MTDRGFTPRRRATDLNAQAIQEPLPLPSAGLSIDVEDYYHVEASADRITPDMWPQFPSPVVKNTHVLGLQGRLGVRAIFFVLGVESPNRNRSWCGRLLTQVMNKAATAICTVGSGC